jgi:hypothetical protein
VVGDFITNNQVRKRSAGDQAMSDYSIYMEIAEATLAKEGKAPQKTVRRGPTEDREVDEKDEKESDKKE